MSIKPVFGRKLGTDVFDRSLSMVFLAMMQFHIRHASNVARHEI
jgi:hypothetical protein